MNVNVNMPSISNYDLTPIKNDTVSNSSKDTSQVDDKSQFKNILNNIHKDKASNTKSSDEKADSDKSTLDGLKENNDNAVQSSEGSSADNDASKQVDKSNMLTNVNKDKKVNTEKDTVTKDSASSDKTSSDDIKKLKEMLDKGEINLDQLVALLSNLLANSSDKVEPVKSDALRGNSKNDDISVITLNLKDNSNALVPKSSDEKLKNFSNGVNKSENSELTDILKQMISEAKAKNPEILNQIKSIVNSYNLTKGIVKSGQVKNADNKTEVIEKATSINTSANENKILPVEAIVQNSVTQPDKSKDSLKNDIVNLLVKLTDKADETEKTTNVSPDGKIDNLSKLISVLKKENTEVSSNDELNITKEQSEDSYANFKSDNLDSTSKANIVSKNEAVVSTKNEDKLLKSIITGDDGNKTTKLNAFLVTLNNQRNDVAVVKTTDLPVVNKNSMVQDIVKTVNYMNNNNLKELTVKIAPRELGEIEIKLTLEAGNTRASISAHNKEAYDILSSSLNDIKSALSNADLKIQNVNINIYQDDTTFFRNGFAGNGQQGNEQQNQNQKFTTSTQEIADESTVSDISEDNNLSAWV